MPEEQPNPYETTGRVSQSANATSPGRAFLLLNVVLISFIAGLIVIALMVPTGTVSHSTTDAHGNPITMHSTFTTTVNLSLRGLATTSMLMGVANALLLLYFWVARWTGKRV